MKTIIKLHFENMIPHQDADTLIMKTFRQKIIGKIIESFDPFKLLSSFIMINAALSFYLLWDWDELRIGRDKI